MKAGRVPRAGWQVWGAGNLVRGEPCEGRQDDSGTMLLGALEPGTCNFGVMSV